MARTAPLPYAEAKIRIRNFGTDTWRDSLDFEPAMIPVENRDMSTTDVYDPTVMSLVTAIIEAEVPEGHPQFEYMLVWSETGRAVKGVCPECDDIFIVSEGFTNDTFNGSAAAMCGCVDDDEVDFSDGNDEEIDFAG